MPLLSGARIMYIYKNGKRGVPVYRNYDVKNVFWAARRAQKAHNIRESRECTKRMWEVRLCNYYEIMENIVRYQI